MLNSLTIKARITIMGVAAVVGLAVIFLIAELAARNVTSAAKAGEEVRADLQILAEMQLANLDLLLNAMDTIVDKDAGSVDPDRVKAMSGSIDLLSDNVDAVNRMAERSGKSSAARGFLDKVKSLDDFATRDLVRAVETKASDDVFGQLDDDIDGTAETGRAADSVLHAANALAGHVARLREGVSHFLQGIRTA